MRILCTYADADADAHLKVYTMYTFVGIVFVNLISVLSFLKYHEFLTKLSTTFNVVALDDVQYLNLVSTNSFLERLLL